MRLMWSRSVDIDYLMSIIPLMASNGQGRAASLTRPSERIFDASPHPFQTKAKAASGLCHEHWFCLTADLYRCCARLTVRQQSG